MYLKRFICKKNRLAKSKNCHCVYRSRILLHDFFFVLFFCFFFCVCVWMCSGFRFGSAYENNCRVAKLLFLTATVPKYLKTDVITDTTRTQLKLCPTATRHTGRGKMCFCSATANVLGSSTATNDNTMEETDPVEYGGGGGGNVHCVCMVLFLVFFFFYFFIFFIIIIPSLFLYTLCVTLYGLNSDFRAIVNRTELCATGAGFFLFARRMFCCFINSLSTQIMFYEYENVIR